MALLSFGHNTLPSKTEDLVHFSPYNLLGQQLFHFSFSTEIALSPRAKARLGD